MKTMWDLSHLYNNDLEWENDFKELESKINSLNEITDFISTIEKFTNFLELKIEAEILVEKLYCYAKRHLDVDSTLGNYKKMMQEALSLYNNILMINNRFENEIISNDEKIKQYLKTEKLKKYERYIHLILRRKNHIVSTNELQEKGLDYPTKIQELKDSYQELFNTIIKFDNIEIDGEEVNVNRTNYNSLILNEKQENRKHIFDVYTAAYEKANNELASIYLEKLKNDIELALLENYDSLLGKKLFELELPDKILTVLINEVNKNLNIMHSYTELKKKISGLEHYHIYDATASVSEIPKIEIEFNEAVDIVKKSLGVLGTDYINLINRMFNEGWIDVYPKDNKRTMSFTCISYTGVPYVLINYDKLISSVRTLGHEIGHSVNTYYSKINNEYIYFEFSYFLTEIASKVNEILVNEYMLDNCKTIEEKKYILNSIISNIGNSLFGQIMLTEFEHSIINKLSNNEKITANELNELYFEISEKYNGSSLEYDDNIKYGWSKIPHFIMQDTYYVYQYSIGICIASNIAYRILNKEDNIIEKYIKFLSAGNSVSVKEALKYVDIDLNNSDYINDTIKTLSKKIDQLKQLY